MRKKIDERFWEKVDRKGEKECWLWIGNIGANGYGQLSIKNKTISAHRLSWTLNYGPILDGLFVLHECDNPPCVNPNHLFLGTNKDNILDAIAKGRLNPLGKSNLSLYLYKAKVHENQVREIRQKYSQGLVTFRMLAREYKVSKKTIHRIVRYKTWKNVE